MKTLLLPALASFAIIGAASAAPAAYKIDSDHTYPSFDADHMGISVWRGKFNKTTGQVMLDKEAGAGTIDIAVDVASIDFGQEQLNKWARGKEFLNAAKYPKALYKGRLEGFVNGVPTQASGDLTLHGVTRPLTIKLNSFKCMPHPMFKRDWCGSDALATIDREQFGLGAGKEWGFKMDVVLRIQVEAVAVK
jgi:polyisoprenoid-binding protein YceI